MSILLMMYFVLLLMWMALMRAAKPFAFRKSELLPHFPAASSTPFSWHGGGVGTGTGGVGVGRADAQTALKWCACGVGAHTPSRRSTHASA